MDHKLETYISFNAGNATKVSWRRRLQISTNHPLSAHLSLFDTNCTLSGSGCLAVFSSLSPKFTLTVGHHWEEPSYLTRQTCIGDDVIKATDLIFKHPFFFLSLYLPSILNLLLFSSTSEPVSNLPGSERMTAVETLSAVSDVLLALRCALCVIADKFSSQNKRM